MKKYQAIPVARLRRLRLCVLVAFSVALIEFVMLVKELLS